MKGEDYEKNVMFIVIIILMTVVTAVQAEVKARICFSYTLLRDIIFLKEIRT